MHQLTIQTMELVQDALRIRALSTQTVRVTMRVIISVMVRGKEGGGSGVTEEGQGQGQDEVVSTQIARWNFRVSLYMKLGVRMRPCLH